MWVQVGTCRNRWWLLTGWPSLSPFLFFSVCTVKRSRTRENNTTPEGYQPWRTTNRDRRDEGSLVFRLNATCSSLSFYFHTAYSCFYSLLPFFFISPFILFLFSFFLRGMLVRALFCLGMLCLFLAACVLRYLQYFKIDVLISWLEMDFWRDLWLFQALCLFDDGKFWD